MTTYRKHLDVAKDAIALLRLHLESEATDDEIRNALSAVTDEYSRLVDSFCSQPDSRRAGIWDVWNLLGSAYHYNYLKTATRER